MKYTVPLLILLQFFILTVSNAQQTESKIFHQVKADTLNRKLGKMMIIGIGSTSSRIFLERLGEKLVTKFTAKGLKAEYMYMGKTISEAKQKFDTLANNNFDAFLVFTPKDTSFFGTTAELNNNIATGLFLGGNANSREKSYYISYHQDFHVRLYHASDKTNFVWSGLLNADCDLTSAGIYKHISKMILNCFRKNRYM